MLFLFVHLRASKRFVIRLCAEIRAWIRRTTPFATAAVAIWRRPNYLQASSSFLIATWLCQCAMYLCDLCAFVFHGMYHLMRVAHA